MGSDSDDSLDRQLKKHRKEKKERRKEEKERKKEYETPEERRQRRMQKKALKTEKHVESLPALPDNIPYSNYDNPFNDTSLTKSFVWDKKIKAEGNDNLSRKDIEKANREKIFKNVAEMEELKRNRDARQRAREDMEMISRDEERKHHNDWKNVEHKFHLKQEKLRTKLRIRENRAMPIDFLSRYICYGDEEKEKAGIDKFDEFDEFEMEPPTNYIKNLTVEQYEDLMVDIKGYRLIDNGSHNDFWDDVSVIVAAKLKDLNKVEEENIHNSVLDNVKATFEGKSYEQLQSTFHDIKKKIKSAGRNTDVSFWEAALEHLKPKMAETRLKDLHAKMLKLRLARIRAGVRKEAEKFEEKSGFQIPSSSKSSEHYRTDDGRSTLNKADLEEIEAYDSAKPLPFTVQEMGTWDDETKETKWMLLNPSQLERFAMEMYREGAYSPDYTKDTDAMPGIEILDEITDTKSMQRKRDEERQTSGVSNAEKQFMEIAKRGMGGDEVRFAVEEDLGDQELLWADKFRPQKPKYFNRVHTGFDWNKYNQTHYDMDNPPPKIVQGYRFNIFYPALLDKTKTPQFVLTECKEDKDFAIIRFTASPPYEDIAFKIVNREWEVSHKHGYKCQFQNDVFQLWFFFKRYRYRR